MRRGAKPNRLQIENRISAAELLALPVGDSTRLTLPQKGDQPSALRPNTTLRVAKFLHCPAQKPFIVLRFLFPRLLGGEGAVLCSFGSLGSTLSFEGEIFKRSPVAYTTSR